MRTLNIYSAFPNDEASRRQTAYIFRDEWEREKKCGESYSPSLTYKTVREAMFKQVVNRGVVGLMAIVMCARGEAGESMSLRKASEIVGEFARKRNVVETYIWREGEIERPEGGSRITKDQGRLREIFREYRSSAHICAAEVLQSEHYGRVSEYFVTDHEARRLVATAIFFQERLKEANNFDDWDIWKIEADFGKYGAPRPFLPRIEFLELVLGRSAEETLSKGG